MKKPKRTSWLFLAFLSLLAAIPSCIAANVGMMSEDARAVFGPLSIILFIVVIICLFLAWLMMPHPEDEDHKMPPRSGNWNIT